jgi:hypothetical protein
MICKSCAADKPQDGFYLSNKTRCKECIKESVRANRLERIEHYRSYDALRASQPHRVALAKRVNAEWKDAHPERRAANIAVGNAVRDGKLHKQPCWVCGLSAVAHHPDYDRPLDVVWLCQPHHKQAHALVAA